jgi:hypothetical protein
VLFVAFVLFGKDPFKPTRLFLSDPSIRGRRMVSDEKLLAATIAPECAHFVKARGRFLSGLTLLYCHCLHLLNFSEFAGR